MTPSVTVKTYMDIEGLEDAVLEAARPALKRGALRIRDSAKRSMHQAPSPESVSLIDLLPDALKPFANSPIMELVKVAKEIGIPAKVIYAARKLLRGGKGKFKKNKQLPSAPGEPPHVQTGKLKENVTAAQDEKSGNVRVGIKSDAWYGVVHELGSRKHPKRPFLLPALQREGPKLADEFRDMRLHETKAGRRMNARKTA